MKPESNAPLWIMGGILVAAGLIFSGKTEHSDASTPEPAAAVPEPLQPVSGECDSSARLASEKGLIRPGTIDKEGGVLLTDSRWPGLTVELQRYTAECLSHYLAGGQNRWAKRLTFQNQRTGVVYGTIEGDRYRIGP